MIALSAVARHSRALCTDLAMGPLKSHAVGVVKPQAIIVWDPLNRWALAPLSLCLPHPKI